MNDMFPKATTAARVLCRRTAMAAILPALAALAAPAGAQIEEVIVTAQRREQSLQDTPVSVTAFTATALEARLMDNLADLTRFVPNLELNNGRADGGGSNAAIFIRGVGQADFIFPTDPGVGVYLDGVYLGRTLGGMMDLVDLQRLEVLRGPQGTLYGKNTIAGAINLVTARPSGRFGGVAGVTGGRFDRIDGSLSVDFPLIEDRLNGKISFSSRNRDGFGESLIDGREFDDIDRRALRAVFDWKAADTVDVLFSADYSTWDQNGAMSSLERVFPSANGFRELLFNTIAAPFLAARMGLAPGAVFDERWISQDFDQTFATGPVRDEGDVWGVSATVDWEIRDKLRLKSITSWREMDLHFGSDLDNTPFDFAQTDQRQDQNQLAQELQLSGLALNDRLDWLAGVYFFRERGQDENFVQFGDGMLDALAAFPGPFIPLVPGVACPPPPGVPLPCAGGAGNPVNLLLDTNLIPITKIDTNSYSIYGHAILDITQRLSLSAGARFTYEDKRWFITSFRPTSGAFAVPPSELQEHWGAFTPKLGAEYALTDELMIYGQVSRGFKSGGWNPRMFVADFLDSYDPEYLTSHEFGFKSQWFDRRLTVNAAFFLYDYEDLQLSAFVPNPDPTLVILTTDNAGEVDIEGFELEIAARPTEHLDVQIGVGYQTNEYKQLDATVPWSIDNVLPDAPKWTVSAGVQYRLPLADLGYLVPRLDASYKSRTHKDPFNSEDIVQGDLILLNLQLGFQSLDEKWQLTAFATNVTDEEYITRGLHFSDFGFTNHYPGRPREWGVTASYRF